ncbi:MAG: UDP-N-acetylmuramoyl-L-alanyl-D-glutamate--2,6-diaminopimelate ligase [Deltaproteobacteria bacterium]|nr:UDP-N-acetylmuramoyl-L-alanyl-D-glutamate--2,6-diaminopimelate ligase [Deltaproteobacteria bacterium]
MRLTSLINGLACDAAAMPDVEVASIVYDSRKSAGGAMFAALPGEHADGSDFIKDAVRRGASCVLVRKAVEGLGVPQVVVADVRETMALLSARICGEPSRRMKLAGITGTNGKTTTTYLLESIFRQAGLTSGVIGTVNYRYAGKVVEAPHTTPEAPDLQRLLKDMLDAGVTHAAMEVSSHALAQKRVLATFFDAAVFTNITHEHLDYHKDMEEYFRCKSILFRGHLKDGGAAVVNIDDIWGRRLAGDLHPVLTFSLGPGASIWPEEYRFDGDGINAKIQTPAGLVTVSSSLAGEYNLCNILGAAGAALALGMKPAEIENGINALRRVPGRLDRIGCVGRDKRFAAYVDYAHTGDALERVLEALKGMTMGRGGRVITVFGCGGNRDRLKRPQMGGISARLSDFTIITSDNPRDEDPLDIIMEIESGMGAARCFKAEDKPAAGGYMLIPDRRDAIRRAVAMAGNNDVILVAGKGHEDYQIIGGVKTPFSDMEELREAIKEFYGEEGVSG